MSRSLQLKAGAQTVAATLKQDGRRVLLTFAHDVHLKTGERLTVEVA